MCNYYFYILELFKYFTFFSVIAFAVSTLFIFINLRKKNELETIGIFAISFSFFKNIREIYRKNNGIDLIFIANKLSIYLSIYGFIVYLALGLVGFLLCEIL